MGNEGFKKEYTAEFTISALPASDRQVESLLTIAQILKTDTSYILVIGLPNHDDPQELSVSYYDDGYYMELSFPMDDFGWSHPLVLARSEMSYEEVESVITGVLLNGLSTEEIITLRRFENTTPVANRSPEGCFPSGLCPFLCC